MTLRHLHELPAQIQYAIQTIDQADTLVSQLSRDATRDDDANSFKTPHEDIIVILDLIHGNLQRSLDSLASCRY